jgi:site-specific recombinase XerD
VTTRAFVTLPGVLQKLHEGPLGKYIDLYAAELSRKGYRREPGRRCIKVVSFLSLWLQRKGVGADALDECLLDQYLQDRLKQYAYCNRHDRAAVEQLLALLRAHGVCSPRLPAAPDDSAQIIEEFRRHLCGARGLSPASVIRRIPTIRRFLVEHFPTGRIDWTTLSATAVIGFIKRHANDFSPSAAHSMCSALRSFLRYIRYRGEIKQDLASAVPSIKKWKLSELPRFLLPQQVQMVLDSCDRDSAQGKRDFAVLLLLARLGLRSKEVATLTLDNIDWHSGQFTLRNTKTELAVRMPLPIDVGEALADYLQNGRPHSVSRRVFIREQAPRIGFSSSSGIYDIVKCALARAGIDAPCKGPHLFRHSLATQLLRKGATLGEIGQLLRHQDPDTTRIYAKVDVSTLRGLSLPWPGGAR